MQSSRTATGLVGAALQVLLLTAPANGQETTRVSVDSTGAEGNDHSGAEGYEDSGWVYGTVSSDGQGVTSAGQVRTCMGCHEQAPHDRLFGIDYHGA